jgi:hypothetical protein
MTASRQRVLILILIALALIAAWRYFLAPMLGIGGDEAPAPAVAARPATDGEGDPLARTGRSNANEQRHGARPGDHVAVLRLADLDRVPAESPGGRDPWRFVDPPPPPPPAPPKGPSAEELRRLEEARRLAEQRAREAAQALAVEAAKPKPAEFTLQYLGRFGPADKKLAVFTNGKDVQNVLEGDVIDNKFIVAHIGLESVDIRFVGFPDWPTKRVGVTPRQQVGGQP